jgi:CBS domain-containing protein
MKVEEIMTSPALTLEPATVLEEAAARLLGHRIAAMPVVDDGRLVGIVGEADLYRAIAAARGVPLGGTVPFDALGRPRTVSDVVRRGVLWVKATDSARLAAQLLMRRARSLPVLDGGRVVGVVSRRDVIGPLIRGTYVDLSAHVPDELAARSTMKAGVPTARSSSTRPPLQRHVTARRPTQDDGVTENAARVPADR